MNVAVIPARGGSVRVPRKNVRSFVGKPMIAHSVERAIASGLFERVIVSTDDDEIAAVSAEYGAQVPFRRPAVLSGDTVGITDVIAHAVDWLRRAGDDPVAVCCIYATAPFVQAEDLATGLAVLNGADWSYVFSATTFGFPIFRSFELDAAQGVKMFYPEHFSTRSQDLPEAYHDAGQFCWGRASAWADRVRIFGSASTIVRIPRWRVQDIDTLEDWERAEIVWRLLRDADPG